MSKIHKKQFEERDVHEAALERFHILYDRYDKVVVSFSGGKDSTVCLNLALQVARERGRLPLDVYFWDEEAIHPETIEYCERVSRIPDVRFKWLCMEIKHRNACSRREPYWICWDEDARDRWVRDMPPEAITTLPGFWKGATVPEVAHLVYGPEHGMVADVRGLRADESLRRYQSVASRLKDNWIGDPREGYSYPVSPIYDWTTVDVWTAPKLLGWDYNRAYDLMSKAGVPPHRQRVCPPFGEEPLGGLWLYQVCWPDLWDRMVNRVHGAATAMRYADTELYGFKKLAKPDGMTWREWAFSLLDLYPPELRAAVAKGVNRTIKMHKSKTNRPIPTEEPDALTGVSWKNIAMIINRGDLKGRRAGMLNSHAVSRREKEGVSMEDVMDDVEDGTRY